MTRKQRLIGWSAARDFLDIIWIGQIPVLSQILSLPIWIMHFSYAGKAALFTLLEMMPGVGLFPVFTTAACCYPDYDDPSGGGAPTLTVAPGHASFAPPQQHSSRATSPVAPIVEGELISDSVDSVGVRQVDSQQLN